VFPLLLALTGVGEICSDVAGAWYVAGAWAVSSRVSSNVLVYTVRQHLIFYICAGIGKKS
jgi:hypothetical protein